MSQRILSAKVREELVEQLDATANEQGISRNAVVRQVLEAFVDGRPVSFTDPNAWRRRLREIREGIHGERQRKFKTVQARSNGSWGPKSST